MSFVSSELESITTIRELYFQSVSSQKTTESLLSLLDDQPQDEAVVWGYKGAAQSLMAKHVWNPVNKMDWLAKCEKSFNKATAIDAKNIEVRFLRFAYQHYLPAFLGHSKNIDEDIKVICEQLKYSPEQLRSSPELKQNVINFMVESGRLSDEQEEDLQKMIASAQ